MVEGATPAQTPRLLPVAQRWGGGPRSGGGVSRRTMFLPPRERRWPGGSDEGAVDAAPVSADRTGGSGLPRERRAASLRRAGAGGPHADTAALETRKSMTAFILLAATARTQDVSTESAPFLDRSADASAG